MYIMLNASENVKRRVNADKIMLAGKCFTNKIRSTVLFSTTLLVLLHCIVTNVTFRTICNDIVTCLIPSLS
ncbi:Uncharacterised protein [Salmonella enterica]|nr:Uncharacterised protein [Salmonella enterica]